MNAVGSQIVLCLKCGAKNRIPKEKAETEGKCGKCGAPLKAPIRKSSSEEPDTFFFRCPGCGTRNKIPPEKAKASPRCGKCKQPLRAEELFVPQPLMITDGNFEEKVLKSPLPALIFAWAPWCPTCRTFLPVIDRYAGGVIGKTRVGKLNVDENPATSSSYSILSVPQILIFDNGQLKETMPGALSENEIRSKMGAYA
jgi:thiol-disulfide isomerase/thioredoxin